MQKGLLGTLPLFKNTEVRHKVSEKLRSFRVLSNAAHKSQQ
jgi:hypothetical protein